MDSTSTLIWGVIFGPMSFQVLYWWHYLFLLKFKVHVELKLEG